MNDLYADLFLAQNKISRQYYDMIDFIENEIKPRIYNQLTKKYEKIAIVGHSLGGYLAQLFALSYHSLVDKVYTFNTPGVFNDKVKKLIDTIDNGAMSVISLLMCNITGIVGLSIYSLFQSKTKSGSFWIRI